MGLASMVDKHDLDRTHSERVSSAVNMIESDEEGGFDELVLSERVSNDLNLENVVLHSFNEDAIRAYLPYSSRIYVMTCPECITEDNIGSYTTLLQSGSIVPVLPGRYSHYADSVVDVTYSHDHVGSQEYFALRSMFSNDSDHPRICGHCVGERGKTLRTALSRSKFKGFTSRNLDVVLNNLHPYVRPDFDLIDELESAISNRELDSAKAIVELSWTLSHMRASSVFNAPLIVPGKAYEQLPAGYSSDIDDTRNKSVETHKKISDGLGIQIPKDISLNEYIEISGDFRPRIESILSQISASSEESEWKHSLDREIMNLNAETSRLSKSKRYIALAAAVEFYKNNQIKINAALVAGSLSLSGGLLGCVGGGAATIAAGLAKNKGLITSGPSVSRAARAVKNSIQPTLDRLIGLYTGTSPMAVSVVSLKRDLEAIAPKV